MIDTDSPYALVLTLTIVLAAVAGLELGVLAPGGGAAEPVASGTDGGGTSTGGGPGNGSDAAGGPPPVPPGRNPGVDLTDSEGRLHAERLYDEPPARFADKRGQFERAVEIQEPTGFINADSVNLSRYVGEKVILVEFWTFGCYNCQNTHPHIKEYWREYGDEGLVVIGVHKPEFAYERKPANVREYVQKTNTTYPVVLDNRDATWDAYGQRAWPTRYLIGVDGFIRYQHVGEGAYDETERMIRRLLEERDEVVDES